jgi:hypothetical protein
MVLAIVRGGRLGWPSLVNIPPKRMLFAAIAAVLITRSNISGWELPERSVSPSGQFIVYGADTRSRGAVSDLAERTKKDLLGVLRRHDDWKNPIVISLQARAANLPELRPSHLELGRTETGMKLQLDLVIGSKLDTELMEHELARVILLEMIYRNSAGLARPGAGYVDPPNWIVEGLLVSASNRDRATVVAALDAAKQVPSLDEFLQQRALTLDSVARELYRAYSYGLLQLLLERRDGQLRVGRYIDNLALASNDPLADLRAAFPEVRDWEGLWQSAIANLKLLAKGEGLLSFVQTDSKLNEILRVTFPPAHGRDTFMPLEQLSRVTLNSQQRQALQKLSQRLLILATQANPVLRPIVESYQRIADQLALGKNRRAAPRLAELKSLHEKVSARMSEIDDYMNWFEAAKMETPSGLFEQEAKPAREIGTAKRKDVLSVYLDAIELEF